MTCVPRQHDSAARRLTTAETIIVPATRAKSDPAPRRPQLSSGAPAPASESVRSVIRIDRPGTYRLAADVVGGENTVGILISADHVTLDLAGFSVVGKTGSLSGIRVMGARTNVAVRNGTVRAWGGHGVDLADATESHAELLRVTDNSGDGVALGANSSAAEIQSCSNSRDGITAGDGAALRRCVARANSGAGIRLGDSSFAQECMSTGNARDGITAGVGAIVRGCVARHNHGAGVVVGDAGSVRDSELIQNERAGVRAGADAVIADNRCVPAPGQDPITAGPNSTIRDNVAPGVARSAA